MILETIPSSSLSNPLCSVYHPLYKYFYSHNSAASEEGIQAQTPFSQQQGMFWLLFLIFSATLCAQFTQKLETQQCLPLTLNNENIINFAVANSTSQDSVVGASTAGFAFKFSGLPAWVDMVNGGTIAGIPTKADNSNFTVTYTDSRGNSYTKVVSLGNSATSMGASNSQQNFQKSGSISFVSSSSSVGDNSNPSSRFDPSVITVLLPASQGASLILSGNPTLVSLQAPPQSSSINYVTANTNSYSSDAIQAIVSSQAVAHDTYLNTILAISQARQNLNGLNSSADEVNRNLSLAADYFNTTQTQYNQALLQQQTSSQKMAAANASLGVIQNQLQTDTQKSNTMSDLIAKIQVQIAQAGALKQKAGDTLASSMDSVSDAQNQVDSASKAISDTNIQISATMKQISDSQNILAVYSSNIYLAESDLNSSNARLKAAQAQLIAAQAAQKQAQSSYDTLKSQYNNAPLIINSSNSLIVQLKQSINGQLTQNLNAANYKLSDTKMEMASAKQYVQQVNNASDTLQQQLGTAQQASSNLSLTIKNNQGLMTSANNAYRQIMSNKAIDDSNVFTLKTQLGMAQDNIDKAQAASDNLKQQIGNASNAYRIAVTAFTVAQAGKVSSDSEIRKVLALGLDGSNGGSSLGNLKGRG